MRHGVGKRVGNNVSHMREGKGQRTCCWRPRVVKLTTWLTTKLHRYHAMRAKFVFSKGTTAQSTYSGLRGGLPSLLESPPPPYVLPPSPTPTGGPTQPPWSRHQQTQAATAKQRHKHRAFTHCSGAEHRTNCGYNQHQRWQQWRPGVVASEGGHCAVRLAVQPADRPDCGCADRSRPPRLQVQRRCRGRRAGRGGSAATCARARRCGPAGAVSRHRLSTEAPAGLLPEAAGAVPRGRAPDGRRAGGDAAERRGGLGRRQHGLPIKARRSAGRVSRRARSEFVRLLRERFARHARHRDQRVLHQHGEGK